MVFPKSIAEEQGLRQGDIILSLDEKLFSTVADLKKYLSHKNWHDQIKFKICRAGAQLGLEFAIEPIPEN